MHEEVGRLMTPGNDLKAKGSGIFEILSANLPKGSEVNLEKKLRISCVSRESNGASPESESPRLPLHLPARWAGLSALTVERRKIHIEPWL